MQIIYTQIDRDKKNNPKFKDYTFSASKSYFYPASTVKLPVSLLALIKLEELDKKGLDRKTTMLTDSAYYCQKRTKADSISGGSYPTIENYIKRMFLVSDNYSFARTYEFVGYDYAHKKLSEMGYKNIRLLNRLDGQCPGDTAKTTPPIYFLNAQKDTIYKQGLTFPTEKLTHPIKNSLAGAGYTSGNKKIMRPKDFSTHNYLPLTDLHSLMKKIIFNDHLPSREKLPVSDENREFMIRQLGFYPKESEYPRYDKKIFYDSFKKYFIYGSTVATVKGDSIRVINIVGRAFGFLVDCAYIVDFKNNTEFLLTMGIYVNERNIIGSGKYEYDKIGLPMMKDVSLAIYNYERARKKEHEPDLSQVEKLFKK